VVDVVVMHLFKSIPRNERRRRRRRRRRTKRRSVSKVCFVSSACLGKICSLI